MGQVHSACSRPFAIQSIGELQDAEFSTCELLQAIREGDADRVSHLLEENHYDLTVPDSATGETMLHLAIAHGHDGVVMRLLAYATQDPAVLNAKDACQYTPLVRAAIMRNVPLMQILFAEGGRVEDDHLTTWLACWKSGERYGWPLAAEFLVRARGDIAEALKLAVQYRQPAIADMYRAAGASCIPALGLGAQAIRWMSDWGCIRGEDALAVLAHAQRSGSVDTTNALLSSDTVCEAIYGLADQSDKSMGAGIRLFVAAGADAEALVSTAVDRCKRSGQAEGFHDVSGRGKFRQKGFRVLRNLLSVGLPTAHELVRQSRCDDRAMMQALIECGADVLGAMSRLELSAASDLAFLALKSLRRQRGLSEAKKAEKLTAIISNGGASGAASLACQLTKEAGPLDDVVLLIRCGAMLSTALIMALVDRVYQAEHDRTLAPAAGELPARRAFRQVIEAGIDFSPVVTALHREGAHDPTPSDRLTAPTVVDAISVIRYAQLQHLLGKVSLSATEKLVAAKTMISQDAEQAAGELLRDAALAGHTATIKLLVLAGAPATEAFMALGRLLLPAEVMPILSAETLLHLGADFQPAMRQLIKNIEACTAAGDLPSAENNRKALRQLGSTVALVMQRPIVKDV